MSAAAVLLPPTSPLPRSRQAEGLARWLRDRQVPREEVRPLDRAIPLREALAREGLRISPDPLARFACHKVVRVDQLLERPDLDLEG